MPWTRQGGRPRSRRADQHPPCEGGRVRRAGSRTGRASSLDGPGDETSVNLLFAGHELGRIEIYRTGRHPHAQSRISSHGADFVLVMSGHVTLAVDDVPHLLETGDTTLFSGLSSHYCTTRDSPAVTHTLVGHPRD
jgi:hypothetical protein